MYINTLNSCTFASCNKISITECVNSNKQTNNVQRMDKKRPFYRKSTTGKSRHTEYCTMNIIRLWWCTLLPFWLLMK